MCTTELLTWESGYDSYSTVGNVTSDHQYQQLNVPVVPQPGQHMDINIGLSKGAGGGAEAAGSAGILSPDGHYGQFGNTPGLSSQVTDG